VALDGDAKRGKAVRRTLRTALKAFPRRTLRVALASSLGLVHARQGRRASG